MRNFCVSLVFLFLVFVRPHEALSQSGSTPAITDLPSRVKLVCHIGNSFAFDRQDLTNFLRIELLSYGIELVDFQDESTAVVEVESATFQNGSNQLHIRIEHGSTGRRSTSRLEITEASRDVQSRTIALAVLELLRNSWSDLASERSEPEHNVSDHPRREDVEPEIQVSESSRQTFSESNENTLISEKQREFQPVSFPQNRRSQEKRVVTSLDFLFEGRFFSGSQGLLLGGRSGVSLIFQRVPLVLSIDIGAWYGESFDLSGSVGIVSTSSGLSLLWSKRYRFLRVGIGPQIELGWVRAQGHVDDSAATTASHSASFFSVVAVRGIFRFRLHRRVYFLADSRLGYVVAGMRVYADDRRVTGLEGASFSFGLGLSIHF